MKYFFEKNNLLQHITHQNRNTEKNTLKIKKGQKDQFWFSNISAPINFSDLFRCSKCSYLCEVSNETDPEPVDFVILKKSAKKNGLVGFKKKLNTL